MSKEVMTLEALENELMDLRFKIQEKEIQNRVETQYQNYRGKDLRGRDFSYLDLTGSSFREADVTGCDFTGAILHYCSFKDAKGLSKAKFDNAKTQMSAGLDKVKGKDDITPVPFDKELELLRNKEKELMMKKMKLTAKRK